ncbi:MAG: class I SAM-dependent methyltransferase [Deltaproteobacteria bacterium]|nr:class I SAM-dependent methyltransferase [Deltaproteobacteria bacterium]
MLPGQKTIQALFGRPRPPSIYDLFTQNTDGSIHKWHHYFEIYERYFSPYVGRPVTLLEIGVQAGGSLRLWRRYLGKQAQVFGCDVDPACKRLEAEGFPVFIGDQADPTFLQSMLAAIPPLDIVIDDGGHTSRQQLTSFEHIYPRMKDRAIYLVEDTHTNYWQDYIDTPDRATFVEFAKRQADTLHAWHFDRSSIERYGVPPPERAGQVDVPELTRSTFALTFFDSVVVFERRPIVEPWHQRR